MRFRNALKPQGAPFRSDTAHNAPPAGLSLRATASIWVAAGGLVMGLGTLGTAWANEAKPPVENSAMDATLFYQVLISEIQVRQGDLGTAYQIYLDAAKRLRSAQLFHKSVEYALQGRAGEQALIAARAWRQALPQDRQAAEYAAQILIALGRPDEAADPIKAMLRLTPSATLPQVLGGLPRSLSRIADRKVLAQVVDDASAPWREPGKEIAQAWVASSEAWLQANDPIKARQALNRAAKLDPSLLSIGLLASELMVSQPDAEQLIKAQLASHPTDVVRLAYARRLATQQRMAEAGEQLDAVVLSQPDNAPALLTLAAVRLENNQTSAAEAALNRLIALKPAPKADGSPGELGVDIDTAYLLMAQVQEQRKQYAQADDWLRKADPQSEKVKVQSARAKLLLMQGKIQEGIKLLRAMPETEPRDGIAKVNAEVQLWREMKAYGEAMKVLRQANRNYPNDPDLMYDQAMIAEQLGLHAEVEPLLRQVMALKPEDPNAYNALGYSLADRNLRLDEARTLVTKALSLRPGDPFITDSLGWVAFREGQIEQALQLLRQAYQARPDAEIAAHLGEVLWVAGQQDEARRIWQEGRTRDADNKTLQDTLKRFQPAP